MSKKINILEATSTVVLSKGISGLTLDAVAEEANISKGGLLYHYATKDELIKAMNIHVINSFRELIENHATTGCSYHEAYLLGTLDSVKERSMVLDITTSLLAAIATNREVLHLWKEEYNYLNGKLAEEDYKLEYSLLVKSVCDGIWFANLFNFGHLDHKDEQTVINYLLDLLKRGDS